MTRRKRLILVVGVPVVLYTAWWCYVRISVTSVEANALVGRSEASIRSRYGRPDRDWEGYQTLALYIPPSLPPGPIRTLIFHPGGLLHPEGGTVWVWFTERDGEWVCFESCWFADGVQF